MTAVRPDEITLEVAGRLIMVGADRVRQLIRSGYIAKTRNGYTTIPSAVQGYIKFLKEAAAKNTQTSAMTRGQDARAKEVELRVAMQMRELIPMEEAELAMGLIVGRFREEMAGLPARLTRDIELRRKVEAEVHGAQTRIAEALGKLSASLRSGGDPSEAIRAK